MSFPTTECASREEVLAIVLEAVDVMTSGWEQALNGPPGPTTLLRADLGCQSLDVIMLTAETSRRLGRRDIPFEQLLLKDGKPVTDLDLGTLADFLWAQKNSAGSASAATQGDSR